MFGGWGFGFGDSGIGFRVQGSGSCCFRVWNLGFSGLNVRVCGSGFEFKGLGVGSSVWVIRV